MTEHTLLVIAFLLYFTAAFIWPTLRVWRRTGHNPYVLPSSDDVYGFVTQGMRLVILSLMLYLVMQAAWPPLAVVLGRLDWLSHPMLCITGWTGLTLAFLWTVLAQYQMGLSWRIGIDLQHRTGLVTSGLFARSRNPIFLAMRLSLLSLVLLQPNAATIAIALVGDVLMQFQVRLEEGFLLAQHGAPYKTYCATVRRWL